MKHGLGRVRKEADLASFHATEEEHEKTFKCGDLNAEAPEKPTVASDS